MSAEAVTKDDHDDNTAATGDQHEFQAEVSRLLDIVAHALYTDKDIFLRELISNASDAMDRLRYEGLTNPDLIKGSDAFKIRLVTDSDARTLKVIDNGIGMTDKDMIKNLGTIAHSGTAELMRQIKDARKDGEEPDMVSLIGQFGVGFYAAFMVADKVEVLSRPAGQDKAWLWESDGKGTFTVTETTKDKVGTEITLHLNDDASDFLLDEKLRMVVKKYSDHIDYPILLGVGAASTTLNAASALWTRPKSEITEEQYTEFLRSLSNPVDKPWHTIHWRAEGMIEFSALLFVPEELPFDLYDPKREHKVKLYVKRVFITDNCEGLVPPWLRFLRGVVDSQDLPLNISREMLQNNPMVTKIRGAICRKVLSELESRLKDDAKDFESNFWMRYGPVLKEGLYEAHDHRGDIFKVCRFHSTNSTEMTSLAEYVERMQDGQKTIFYISGDNLETLRNSPQLEGYRAKGVEVLLLTDTIDEFWLPVVHEYDGFEFKSVTKGGSDLSKIGKDETRDDKAEDAEKADDAADEPQKPEGEIGELVTYLKDKLGEKVRDVTLSDRLTESAVCLVAAEGDVDMRMEKLLRQHQGYEGQSSRVLEINAAHPLITALAKRVAGGETGAEVEDVAWLLLDQARIIEGENLDDPSAFARRMSRAMENGLIVT